MDNRLNEVLEYIKEERAQKPVIIYDEGALEVGVNEDVDIDDIYSAITLIVDNVVDRGFEYELIDLMLPYFWLNLFTDIAAPTLINDEDGEEYPDYEQCYKIATWLNLEYELSQVSPLVASYIYMLQQNIWRRLDYHKSQGAYLLRELTDAIASFYEIMDQLEEFTEAQADIDVEKFATQLNEIADGLKMMEGERSSVDLASFQN